MVGLTPLAEAVGVSCASIRKYARVGTCAERVLSMAQATGWHVTPHHLRPDLYPNPTDALPAVVAACVAAGEWGHFERAAQALPRRGV